MLAGEHETLNKKQGVTVEGSGEDFTVNGDAKVLCGNVQTANATVYIIDTRPAAEVLIQSPVRRESVSLMNIPATPPGSGGQSSRPGTASDPPAVRPSTTVWPT